jgi:spore coat polysaccharide biosynthesis protein SpsF (cytidylyltransferase family)
MIQLKNFVLERKLLCYRGELTNVYKRFYKLIGQENVRYFLRVNGDSPLIDPNLIDFLISNHDSNYDITTNIFPRSFPKGQSIEIVNSKSFFRIRKA